jgi:hypothetical protein
MKLGWIAVSGPGAGAAERRLELILDTFLSVSTPIARATPGWIDLLCQPGGVRDQILARVQQNQDTLRTSLRSTSIGVFAIEGGWSSVLRGPIDALALCKTGIIAYPGHFFDFVEDGVVVVSLLLPKERFAAATARLLSSI